jgi:hypothetical protein
MRCWQASCATVRVLPFATESYAKRVRETLQRTAFGTRIRTAEHEELIARRLDQVADLYRAAVTETHSPWERAYTGLLRARTLQKAGTQSEFLWRADSLRKSE